MRRCQVWCLLVERQGKGALLVSILEDFFRRMFCVEFDVGTVTTLSGPGTGGGADAGRGCGTGQTDGSDLAAAVVAVCAGSLLRVPRGAGHGAALVDADMGQERVYSGAAVAGGGAA